MSAQPRDWQVGVIGYGEVGRIFAEDLRAQGIAVVSHDRKLGTPAETPLREHADSQGVAFAVSHAELAERADLIISAVTANQAVAVARACQPKVRGAWFLDLNSASPGAKRRAARLVDDAGGTYVEAAVMTSVPPHRIRVPMLLGGGAAAELAPLLAAIGFAPSVAASRIGIAAATKMCRSVVMKGLEAILIESLTAARHHGVEDAVLASLRETFPGIDWERQAAYAFQRVIEHGRRRGEEMREAAETMREAGLDSWLATATADRQEWMAAQTDTGVFGTRQERDFARSPDWRTEADRLLAVLSSKIK